MSYRVKGSAIVRIGGRENSLSRKGGNAKTRLAAGNRDANPVPRSHPFLTKGLHERKTGGLSDFGEIHRYRSGTVLDLHQLPPLRAWHPGQWAHPTSAIEQCIMRVRGLTRQEGLFHGFIFEYNHPLRNQTQKN